MQGSDAVPRPAGRAAEAALALALLLYAAWLALHFAPAIAGPDDNGYWAQGTRLADTGRTWFTLESPAQFVGFHWLRVADGRYVSRYPPGLAVAVGAVHALAGPEASTALNPALALLTLVGVFLVGRRFVSAGWSALATAWLACSPAFTAQALWCFAHMAVACALVWALVLLPRVLAGNLAAAALAGLLAGALPTLRYPEGLLLVVLAGWGLRELWGKPGAWRTGAAFAVGATLPLVPILLRNRDLFGGFTRTAYGLTGEQEGFAVRHLVVHLPGYLAGLVAVGLAFLFPLGVAGLLRLRRDLEHGRTAWLLLALATAPLLLYSAYYWPVHPLAAPGLRFLVPVLPCWAFGGVYLLSGWHASGGRRRRVAVALAVLQTLWGLGALFLQARSLSIERHEKAALAGLTAALRGTASPGDVVLANRQVGQHLDFVGRWRVADVTLIEPAPPRPAQEQGPSPAQAGKEDEQRARYRELAPPAAERRFADDVADWAGAGKIWFAGTGRELARRRGAFAPGTFVVRARVPLPRPRFAPDARDRARPGPSPWNELWESDELIIAEWTGR